MVTYFRERTGPNFFRVFYKNVAQIRYTPKEVGRVFGIAKFTPYVNQLRDWCYEMIKEYGSNDDKQDEDYLKYIEKHSDKKWHKFGMSIYDQSRPNVSPRG